MADIFTQNIRHEADSFYALYRHTDPYEVSFKGISRALLYSGGQRLNAVFLCHMESSLYNDI